MSVRLTKPSEVPQLVEQVEAAPRVALDTEFHAERRYFPRLYLVQVHVPDGDTWILDPRVEGLLDSAAACLRSTPWVVHGGGQDMRLLARALGGLPDEVWDTQIARGLTSTAFPAPYAHLCAHYLDRRIEKGATLSDWSRRPFTAEQIAYAAEDVQLLVPLFDAIAEEVEARGRLGALRLACADARALAIDPDGAERAWRALRGIAWLTPQQACVAQELARWRELQAEANDQPVRSVLGDGLLLELARRQPESVSSLASNRRMPRGVVKHHGAVLVEQIGRAARRPEWAWPVLLRAGSPQWSAHSLLTAFVEAEAQRLQVAPRLLWPREALEDLAASPDPDRARVAALLGPWRDALVGARTLEALTGELWVRIGPGGLETRSHAS